MLPTVERILYATDLGDNARTVFGYAVAVAKRFDAEIHLLHAMPPLGPTGRSLVRNVVPKEKLAALEAQGLKDVRDEIHRRLSEFAEQELGADDWTKTPVSKIVVAEGKQIDTVILEQAEAMNADLIVLGTREHSALDRAFIGSVARNVLYQSPLPVLLVPIPREG